jgi:hypothetical protein
MRLVPPRRSQFAQKVLLSCQLLQRIMPSGKHALAQAEDEVPGTGDCDTLTASEVRSGQTLFTTKRIKQMITIVPMIP